MTNLLKNPSFEGTVEGGEWYEHPSGCGKLPNGWIPSHKIDSEYDGAPEYGYPELGDAQWEYRRRSGDKSFGWGCTWHTHNASPYYIFEQPGLAGRRVRFSVWGYYLVGGSGVENPEHPGLVHDRIGIGTESGIEWSIPLENVVRGYNTKPTWKQHVIEAVAVIDQITLLISSAPEWAGVHTSGPVWDDAYLEIVAEAECWGQPREQYKRIYNVISTVAEAHKVLDIIAAENESAPGLNDGLQTIGPSSDDAGLGMVEDKTAREWNRALPLQDGFRNFYSSYYPRAKVEFPSFGNGWEQYLLWQGNPRWGGITFGPGNCTIRNSGCYITALAMAQRIYGIEAEATPATVNDALGPDGYAPDCLAEWIDIKNRLGLTISSSTKAQADAHINGSGVMLIEVLPRELQHFVLAVEVLGDNDYLVLDPWKNIVAPLSSLYAGWESWRMLTKTGEPEPDPDPDPDPGPQLAKRDMLIGGHFQTGMEGDQAWIAAVGSGIFKFFSFEDAARAKAANPDIVSVVRMFTREQHISGDPATAASRYIATFHDALLANHRSIDYIESWNEMYSSSNREANQWQVEFDKHFAYQIAGLPVDTRACTILAAVGNPPEGWIADLIPAVRAIYETGGCLGYHPYWWCNPAADGLHEMQSWWPWHAGRWQEWDKAFVAHGLYPKYALGEAGVVGSPDGYSLNAHAGWKSSHTLKGDWGRYYAQISQFQQLLKDWNALHGNRCLGAVLFTTGADFINWLNFQIRQAEMEDLATL